MYAEVAWVLVSSGTQVQPQIILDPDYLLDYLSVSYDYDRFNHCKHCMKIHGFIFSYSWSVFSNY